MNLNWDKYRSQDNVIDLISVFTEEENTQALSGFNNALEFLRNVEKNQRIKSKQVAAVAIAQALYIAKQLTGDKN